MGPGPLFLEYVPNSLNFYYYRGVGGAPYPSPNRLTSLLMRNTDLGNFRGLSRARGLAQPEKEAAKHGFNKMVVEDITASTFLSYFPVKTHG